MNPYEILGLERDADKKQIRAVYRILSARLHPDNKKTGDRDAFERIKLAHDVLMDPDRRKRYDTTGRVDLSPVTPERVRLFVSQTMKTVVMATRGDGSSDDPCWDNIRDKIILSIVASRITLNNQKFQIERHLERAVRMLERFKPKQEFDPVGDALRDEKASLENELRLNEDAMELSIEAERVLKTYDYDVGPGPEGQFSPGPTRRPLLGGSRIRVGPREDPTWA